jgi:hypothetical protein
MIQFRDAFLLARLKYKTYLARSIGTTIVVAIGVIAFGIMLFSVSGMSSLVKQVFRDNISGRYLVNLELYHDCSYDDFNQTYSSEGITETCKMAELDLKAFERQYARFDLSEMETHKVADFTYSINLDSITEKKLLDGSFPRDYDLQLKTANELLLSEYIFDGYDLDKPINGAVPVIISENMLSSDFTIQFDDFEANYNFYRKMSSDWVGERFVLDRVRPLEEAISNVYDSPTDTVSPVRTDLEVVIVGILPTRSVSLFGLSYLNEGIYIPSWATNLNSNWGKAFESDHVYNYVIELDSKEDRDKFIEQYYKGSYSQGFNGYVNPIISVFESFQEMIKAIRIVVFVIAGFILGISSLFIFATISKFTSEGKKEIAVFRSYGAQRSDIRKIFNLYIIYVVNLAIVIGLLISLITCVVISLYYNEKIFYALVSAGTTVMVDPPTFILVGLDVIGILLLVVGVNLVGLFAGVFPIWRATKIDPIVALRDE